MHVRMLCICYVYAMYMLRMLSICYVCMHAMYMHACYVYATHVCLLWQCYGNGVPILWLVAEGEWVMKRREEKRREEKGKGGEEKGREGKGREENRR